MPTYTLFSPTDVPGSAYDDQPNTNCTNFFTTAAANAVAIRFYKSTLDVSPTHTVALFDVTTQFLLAQVDTSNEPASGWIETALPIAITLTPNHPYQVGVFSPQGVYTYDYDYFASAPHVSGILTAYKGGDVPVIGCNGSYIYASTVGFGASAAGRSANFWVDVVVTTPVWSPPAGLRYTLFHPSDTPTNFAGGNPVNTGTAFYVTQACEVVAIRFYKNANDPASVRKLGLWDTVTGTLLGQIVVSAESPSGWQELPLSSPVTLQPNHPYTVSMFSSAGGYSYNSSYFLTSVPNGFIVGYNDGDVPSPINVANGVYIYASDLAFPTQGNARTGGYNYWVDPVYVLPSTHTLYAPTDVPPSVAVGPVPPNLVYVVGTDFKVTVPGSILAIRFWKDSTDTAVTRDLAIWTGDGITKLVGIASSGETASGWQQMVLPSPLPITPNTLYTVGILYPAGMVMYGPMVAETSGVLQSDTARFLDSSIITFPTNSTTANRYWADVVFQEATVLHFPLAVADTSTVLALGLQVGRRFPLQVADTSTVTALGFRVEKRFSLNVADTSTVILGFSVVPPPLWDPATVAQLVLDADRIPQGDGTVVANWDSVGSVTSYSAVQATTGAQPTLVKNVLGGRAVVRFDGNDYLIVSPLDTGVDGFSMIVLSWLPIPANYPMLLSYDPNGGWEIRGSGSTGIWQYVGAGGTGFVFNVNINIVNVWRILEGIFRRADNKGYTYTDATLNDSGPSTLGPRTNMALWLGRRNDGYPLTGDIACAIVVKGDLSDTDRQKIEGWLAWRWSITASLPAGHPYKSSPPLAPPPRFPLIVADTSTVKLGFGVSWHFPLVVADTSTVVKLGFEISWHFPLAVADTSTVLALGFRVTRSGFGFSITDISKVHLTYELYVPLNPVLPYTGQDEQQDILVPKAIAYREVWEEGPWVMPSYGQIYPQPVEPIPAPRGTDSVHAEWLKTHPPPPGPRRMGDGDRRPRSVLPPPVRAEPIKRKPILPPNPRRMGDPAPPADNSK